MSFKKRFIKLLQKAKDLFVTTSSFSQGTTTELGHIVNDELRSSLIEL